MGESTRSKQDSKGGKVGKNLGNTDLKYFKGLLLRMYDISQSISDFNLWFDFFFTVSLKSYLRHSENCYWSASYVKHFRTTTSTSVSFLSHRPSASLPCAASYGGPGFSFRCRWASAILPFPFLYPTWERSLCLFPSDQLHSAWKSLHCCKLHDFIFLKAEYIPNPTLSLLSFGWGEQCFNEHRGEKMPFLNWVFGHLN